MISTRIVSVSIYAAVCLLPLGAAGQDLSRYRDVPFGSTVASVAAVTRTGYEARLVDGLTNADIIDGVSAVYGTATLTPAAVRGPAQPPPGAINGSTAIASWQSPTISSR